MQLLPEKKVKEKRTSERDLEALRRIEIANRRLKAERANQKIKTDYSRERQKAKKEFDFFVQDLNGRKSKLLHEIGQLEKYKEKLVKLVVDLEEKIKV